MKNNKKPIKTSQGKLTEKHKCGIKDCENLTKDYARVAGSIILVCNKHIEYIKKVLNKEDEKLYNAKINSGKT